MDVDHILKVRVVVQLVRLFCAGAEQIYACDVSILIVSGVCVSAQSAHEFCMEYFHC